MSFDAGGGTSGRLIERDTLARLATGLFKFDLLGLQTLDLIRTTEQGINRLPGRTAPFSAADVPLDDPLTFRLLGMGLTTGVFRFEPRGMRELLVKMCPETFEDLVALEALYRPGPMEAGYVDLFLERRRNRQAVEYPHPVLREILEPTCGLPIYQEQVMQIAVEFAGYTLSEANQLRRDLGKGKAETLRQQEEKFVTGAVAKHGVSTDLAKAVFTELERYGNFTFCKADCVAYALLTYRTAWLKAHYPRELFDALTTQSPRYCADDPSWPVIARYAMEVGRMHGATPGMGNVDEPPF